ncbi:hypothetical protein HIM_11291 [Hirsutella minnesotensis 3608]|uniref:Uncharacterized protein n=1 Tax=Hirsutella minnesotensis 3608 TaxID=1043627 RepID=A0A0F7ZRB3_9HYPO|nr:hypothetical protein HIM_11291 [Hirsutella minnesotensis 3608]
MSQDKTYLETIRDESTLAKASQGKATLATLLQSSDWKSAVSKWGRGQLLAHRVVCGRSVPYLPFLKKFQDPSVMDPNDCIARLIEGPGRIDDVVHGAEAQLVQHHQPESLGYVWAAMRPFLQQSRVLHTEAASQPSRERRPPQRYGGGVPSNQADLGSSPESGQRPETSASDSDFSSVGYTEKPGGLLLEEDTIQLASFFIRCVLNHAQAMDKRDPFLEFRSKRLLYSYRLGGPQNAFVNAVDDGGIQIYDSKRELLHQVALLEGKRTFQKITDGKADISDELLGQMVGEALALQQNSETTKNENRRTDFITILAATHYLRLFHFHIPTDYVESYKALTGISPSQTGLEGVLKVNSTDWLSMKQRDHREILVSHLLALIHWANQELA